MKILLFSFVIYKSLPLRFSLINLLRSAAHTVSSYWTGALLTMLATRANENERQLSSLKTIRWPPACLVNNVVAIAPTWSVFAQQMSMLEFEYWNFEHFQATTNCVIVAAPIEITKRLNVALSKSHSTKLNVISELKMCYGQTHACLNKIRCQHIE